MSPTTTVVGDLATLIPSWARSLRAENKSPRTILSYTTGAIQFNNFLVDRGMPTAVAAIRREHVESFIEDVLGRARSSTAATRYRDIQQLFRWLEEEGEVTESPMARMRPPKIDESPVPVVADGDLKALFKACAGKTFEHRRDTAIIRVLLNTGARLAEVTGLAVDDVDLDLREMYVMGKGRKGRALPLGPKAIKDLDRYLRVRSRHKDAGEPWLWLARKGHLTTSGIAQLIKRRCRQAGIPEIHPHQFRHTMSHKWLASGGTEHDLAKINGWTSLQMVGRYASSAATERAKSAHARLSPGEDL